MRAVSGPDISAFQKSVSHSDLPPRLAPDEPAGTAEFDRWRRELTGDAAKAAPTSAATDPPLEPYRPDMLPGARPDPYQPSQESRIIRRDPLPSPGSSLDDAGAARGLSMRREGSLRESLLRKPLSSLYDKD